MLELHGEKKIEALGSKVEESNITQEMAVLQSLISPWKWKGKKEKKSYYNRGHSNLDTGFNFVERTKHIAVLVVQ